MRNNDKIIIGTVLVGLSHDFKTTMQYSTF
jgi:hypothetical protein